MTDYKDAEIDAAKTIEVINETTAPQQPKKRGPKGSRSSTPRTEKKEKISTRQLTGMIYLGHSAAAGATGIEAITVTEAEAEQIASALVDVLQHYDFEASAKTLAWANLVGTLATIYGVKMWTYLQEQKT